MDPCGNPLVNISGTMIAWSDLEHNGTMAFDSPSYLRPDGQALMPWVYTVLLIIVQIPLVIIRVVRWRTVRMICMAITLLHLAVYLQAYHSTKFDPSKILVWMPLILIIDAGSMVQVWVLVAEEGELMARLKLPFRSDSHKNPTIAEQKKREKARKEEEAIKLAISRRMRRLVESGDISSGEWEMPHAPWTPVPRDADESERRERDVVRWNEKAREEKMREEVLQLFEKNVVKDGLFWIAVVAFLLFCTVIGMQVVGLLEAIRAVAVTSHPTTSWCSPMFAPFGTVVRTGDCKLYTINQSTTKGIGCIELPGIHQQQWLKGTVGALIVSLILEVFDLAFIIMVNTNDKPNGLKLRRPWCTMIVGFAVLGALLFYSISYASNLPPGITEKVWMVVNVDRPELFTGMLASSGLRGALIGWYDGLLGSWGATYYGSST